MWEFGRAVNGIKRVVLDNETSSSISSPHIAALNSPVVSRVVIKRISQSAALGMSLPQRTPFEKRRDASE
jgi:hypothetical protein